MKKYRIAELRDSRTWQWVVIATDEDGEQDWISKHETQGDAREAIHRLMSKTLDQRAAS